MARLPVVNSDDGTWGNILTDYLRQSINADGSLVTTSTNAYTGTANVNLATTSTAGFVQLAGDLTGTAAAPTLVTTTTAGTVGAFNAIPVITYDAKGRITGTTTFVNPSLALTSNFTTTATTATATNLTFTVAAGESWYVEFNGTAQCSSTGGVKYQVSAPAGATIEGWLQSSTSSITTASLQRITAINTLTSTAVHTALTATPGPDKIWARVTNGATAGSITIAAASVTSGQTTTIFAGASIIARKLALV